jgi:hypothetical protein
MSPRGKKRRETVIKTTVELPVELWQAAKMRAAENRSDLRGVIVKALEKYLAKRFPKREG